MSDINEVRKRLAVLSDWAVIGRAYGDDLRALLADHARLQGKCVGELSLTDAINDYLVAQDALDNWETSGPNRDLYESVMARRNAARRDLESVMRPTKGEAE